jgi:phage baseplate assembly protein W
MKAISYPFTLDVFGVTKSTESQTKIYSDRLVTLLSTAVGERPMRPTYGTSVANALFETENNLRQAINSAIREAIKRWLPEITVQNVAVKSLDESGAAEVSVTIILPDYTSASIVVKSTTLNPNGSTEL